MEIIIKTNVYYELGWGGVESEVYFSFKYYCLFVFTILIYTINSYSLN